MTNHPGLPGNELGLVKVWQPRKLFSPGQTRRDVYPSPPTAISLSGVQVKLGCIHILLSTFLTVQGCSCPHSSACIMHSLTDKRIKKAILGLTQWETNVIQSSPSFLSGVPVRSTSLPVHTVESKWSWQKLKTGLVSVPGEAVHPSITLKCRTWKEESQRKLNYAEAGNSVRGLLRLFPSALFSLWHQSLGPFTAH